MPISIRNLYETSARAAADLVSHTGYRLNHLGCVERVRAARVDESENDRMLVATIEEKLNKGVGRSVLLESLLELGKIGVAEVRIPVGSTGERFIAAKVKWDCRTHKICYEILERPNMKSGYNPLKGLVSFGKTKGATSDQSLAESEEEGVKRGLTREDSIAKVIANSAADPNKPSDQSLEEHLSNSDVDFKEAISLALVYEVIKVGTHINTNLRVDLLNDLFNTSLYEVDMGRVKHKLSNLKSYIEACGISINEDYANPTSLGNRGEWSLLQFVNVFFANMGGLEIVVDNGIGFIGRNDQQTEGLMPGIDSPTKFKYEEAFQVVRFYYGLRRSLGFKGPFVIKNGGEGERSQMTLDFGKYQDMIREDDVNSEVYQLQLERFKKFVQSKKDKSGSRTLSSRVLSRLGVERYHVSKLATTLTKRYASQAQSAVQGEVVVEEITFVKSNLETNKLTDDVSLLDGRSKTHLQCEKEVKESHVIDEDDSVKEVDGIPLSENDAIEVKQPVSKFAIPRLRGDRTVKTVASDSSTLSEMEFKIPNHEKLLLLMGDGSNRKIRSMLPLVQRWTKDNNLNSVAVMMSHDSKSLRGGATEANASILQSRVKRCDVFANRLRETEKMEQSGILKNNPNQHLYRVAIGGMDPWLRVITEGRSGTAYTVMNAPVGNVILELAAQAAVIATILGPALA